MKSKTKLMITTPSDIEIVMTRVLEAPRRLVWQAWTKPELLKRWLFGPDGWSLARCDVDLRVGGTLRYEWSHPQKKTMGMGGVYREVVPEERIVHTELFDEDWTGGETLVTVDFIEENGKTTVAMTVRYASREARDGALKTGMADGMEMGYDRLEILLSELA